MRGTFQIVCQKLTTWKALKLRHRFAKRKASYFSYEYAFNTPKKLLVVTPLLAIQFKLRAGAEKKCNMYKQKENLFFFKQVKLQIYQNQ